MEGLLVLIVIVIVLGIIFSLPLYLCTNLVLWLFHIPFHITLLQAFGVSLLLNVISGLFFGSKEG